MAHYFDTTVTIGWRTFRVAVPTANNGSTYGELLQVVMDANRSWAALGVNTRATVKDNGFLRRRPAGCMTYEDFRAAIL